MTKSLTRQLSLSRKNLVFLSFGALWVTVNSLTNNIFCDTCFVMEEFGDEFF